MPRSMIHVKTVVLVAVASLMLTNAVGCATSRNTTMPAMFGASCSPASQVTRDTRGNVDTIAIETDLLAEVEMETDALTQGMFTPMLSATCRPDHRMSHHALALAFVDSRPANKFDFLPMFKSTAAPGGRAMHQPVRLDLIVDAD